MGVTYTMTAICDKCGTLIEPPQDVRKTDIDVTRWRWEDKWKKSGVMRGLQSKFGQSKLYCAKCAG